MAYQVKALKIKLEKYESNSDNKPKTKTLKPLIVGKYLYLECANAAKEDVKISIKAFTGYKGWLLGSLVASSVNSLFDLQVMADGKPMPDKETEYFDAWKKEGCLFALDPTGNATLEHLAVVFDGYFSDLDDFPCFKELDESKKKLLTSLFNYQIETGNNTDFSSWEDYSEYSEKFAKNLITPSMYLQDSDLNLGKGQKISLPEYGGDLKTGIKLKEIALPEKGKKGGTGYNRGGATIVSGYMSVEEKLNSVLALLDGEYKERFDKLYTLLSHDMYRTVFALSLTDAGWYNQVKVQEIAREVADLFSNPPEQEDKLLEEYRKLLTDRPDLQKELNIPATEKYDELFKVEKALEHSEGEYSVIYLDALLKVLNLDVEGKTFPDPSVKRRIKANGFNKPVATMTLEELETLLDGFRF
jgi:hypothetical protein